MDWGGKGVGKVHEKSGWVVSRGVFYGSREIGRIGGRIGGRMGGGQVENLMIVERSFNVFKSQIVYRDELKLDNNSRYSYCEREK